MTDARRVAAEVAEDAARSSYGKLLAIVAARSGDIAAAEDALADAFAAALRQWPASGVPNNPQGWLVTAARRSASHMRARELTARQGGAVVALLDAERSDDADNTFGDERLKLMFAITHPAIDAEAQTPLMLQTVLGLDAALIAACFLVSPASMGQRLVRAKRKIRDAGIAFAIPHPSEVEGRVDAVLSAIYAAYGTGWEDVLGASPKLGGLAEEAIWLARVVVELMPENAEAKGLLSLMLHCESRRAARRDTAGHFVALRDQDPFTWTKSMVIEAETLLRTAASFGRAGRFQTEAAIQSLHAEQAMTGARLTGPLVQLYDLLVGFAPTVGIRVARAVAHAEHGDGEGALAELDAIAEADGYQPWWAAGLVF